MTQYCAGTCTLLQDGIHVSDHKSVLLVRILLADERQECLFQYGRHIKVCSVMMPVKITSGVAPCMLIPPRTCTFTGCFGRGLGLGVSPFFL